MQAQRWREVCKIDVPGSDPLSWIPMTDYLLAGRLYRIMVPKVDDKEQTWAPDGSGQSGCTADGDPNLVRAGAGAELPMPTIPVGALIARIGGSTADLSGDKERIFLFSVGRYCVLEVPETPKAGALFLGPNESRLSVHLLSGTLTVTLEQAF